ncbi:hypothetical protein F511_11167 [Dorcoceras hygrometricum]|nr:hypothetical protein F511_11167 [Dorcoceras hygrometricum]
MEAIDKARYIWETMELAGSKAWVPSGIAHMPALWTSACGEVLGSWCLLQMQATGPPVIPVPTAPAAYDHESLCDASAGGRSRHYADHRSAQSEADQGKTSSEHSGVLVEYRPAKVVWSSWLKSNQLRTVRCAESR